MKPLELFKEKYQQVKNNFAGARYKAESFADLLSKPKPLKTIKEISDRTSYHISQIRRLLPTVNGLSKTNLHENAFVALHTMRVMMEQLPKDPIRDKLNESLERCLRYHQSEANNLREQELGFPSQDDKSTRERIDGLKSSLVEIVKNPNILLENRSEKKQAVLNVIDKAVGFLPESPLKRSLVNNIDQYTKLTYSSENHQIDLISSDSENQISWSDFNTPLSSVATEINGENHIVTAVFKNDGNLYISNSDNQTIATQYPLGRVEELVADPNEKGQIYLTSIHPESGNAYLSKYDLNQAKILWRTRLSEPDQKAFTDIAFSHKDKQIVLHNDLKKRLEFYDAKNGQLVKNLRHIKSSGLHQTRLSVNKDGTVNSSEEALRFFVNLPNTFRIMSPEGELIESQDFFDVNKTDINIIDHQTDSKGNFYVLAKLGENHLVMQRDSENNSNFQLLNPEINRPFHLSIDEANERFLISAHVKQGKGEISKIESYPITPLTIQGESSSNKDIKAIEAKMKINEKSPNDSSSKLMEVLAKLNANKTENSRRFEILDQTDSSKDPDVILLQDRHNFVDENGVGRNFDKTVSDLQLELLEALYNENLLEAIIPEGPKSVSMNKLRSSDPTDFMSIELMKLKHPGLDVKIVEKDLKTHFLHTYTSMLKYIMVFTNPDLIEERFRNDPDNNADEFIRNSNIGFHGEINHLIKLLSDDEYNNVIASDIAEESFEEALMNYFPDQEIKLIDLRALDGMYPHIKNFNKPIYFPIEIKYPNLTVSKLLDKTGELYNQEETFHNERDKDITKNTVELSSQKTPGKMLGMVIGDKHLKSLKNKMEAEGLRVAVVGEP